MSGRNVSSKNPVASRRVVVEIRSGSTIDHQSVSGNDNKYLHTIYAVCEGENKSIKYVYYDDKTLATNSTLNGNNYSYGNDSTGWNLGITNQTTTDDIFIHSFMGTDTQPALTGIPDWANNANAKVAGVAYVYVRLKFNANYFPNGAPNISFLVRGKKLYNPFKDSTLSGAPYYGNGTHRINGAGWEYSNNPVICLIDYLTNTKYGVGIPFRK